MNERNRLSASRRCEDNNPRISINVSDALLLTWPCASMIASIGSTTAFVSLIGAHNFNSAGKDTCRSFKNRNKLLTVIEADRILENCASDSTLPAFPNNCASEMKSSKYRSGK